MIILLANCGALSEIEGCYMQVGISFAKIVLISIRPGTETLGRIPGTDMFCDINQYPMAAKTPGVVIIRVKSALLCFANANIIVERYVLDTYIYTRTHTRKIQS
jgi:low affinity sulfate transporter 2